MDNSELSKSVEYLAPVKHLQRLARVVSGVVNTYAGWFGNRQCQRRVGALGAVQTSYETEVRG